MPYDIDVTAVTDGAAADREQPRPWQNDAVLRIGSHRTYGIASL
jgi:hypothetical protein